MIKVILWDIDNTLLDFNLAEEAAISACFKAHDLGICTPAMLKRYTLINRKYWEMLERGEITKPEVLVGRFKEFFASEGLPVEKAAPFNEDYQIRLGDTCIFRDKGDVLIQDLKKQGYRQFVVTNGTQTAQKRKMKNSGLEQWIEKAFISDEIGIEKPMKGFFDAVWNEIGSYKKDEIIIIGDSLTSDMRGGYNAGITTCWYNPFSQNNDLQIPVDYEISNLQQVIPLLASIS